MITQQRLKELLTYAPETGHFFWNNDMQGGAGKKGQTAGYNSSCGSKSKSIYTKIGLDGQRYLAHRLAWLYVHGELPSLHIDHINGDGLDNRMCNLRLATKSQNGFNAKLSKRNKLGLKGVYYDKRKNKYVSEIRINNQRIHIGLFETPIEAHKAYMAKAVALAGEFARSH